MFAMGFGQGRNRDVGAGTPQLVQLTPQVFVVLALEQTRHRAQSQGLVFGFEGQAALGAGQTQPKTTLGPGECHIQQTHVFVFVGFGDVGFFAVLVIILGRFFGFLGGGSFEAAQERHEHQGVLEAFALVISDDLHTLVVGFQAHFLCFRTVAAGLDVVRQMLQQSRWALQALAGVLQQFTQMQQVGQTAFPLRRLQQTLRHTLLVQPAVDHGQNAMLLPLNKPAVARLGQRIGQRVVLQKGLQLRHVKAPNAAGHRTAQPQGLTRRTDRTQHAPQVLRFIALKHIHVVRHEHTGDAALAQCLLHGLGLHMGAHQHRHVARLHIRVLVQQRHHLRGKALRHLLQMQWCSPMFAVGRRRQKPCGQGLVRLTACLQRLSLAAALHWLEFNLAQFGIKRMADAAKHMVDRCHQRGCGAEVAVQAVQRLGVDLKGFLSRLDVGAEVGPTETVDGLFGVANHDQRMAVVVRGMRVNSV